MSELARIQEIINELTKAINSVTALTEIDEKTIDQMLSTETPEEVTVPEESKTMQAAGLADATTYATTVQTLLTDLKQNAENWSEWLDSESSRIAATVTAPPQVTSPTHKIIQQTITVKPPPAVPMVIYDHLLQLADLIYYYVIAALTGEIELKPTDIDRYIDDFIKIVEVLSKVTAGA